MYGRSWRALDLILAAGGAASVRKRRAQGRERVANCLPAVAVRG